MTNIGSLLKLAHNIHSLTISISSLYRSITDDNMEICSIIPDHRQKHCDLFVIQDIRNSISSIFFFNISVAKPVSSGTRISLQGTYTTHQFIWNSYNVVYQSQHGFMNSSHENIFYSYTTPIAFTSAMPHISAPLHMNLWAFQGKPPTDGQEVEITIHDFKYTQA
ncbi:unnamed protein product [Adineta steineri]|uniref:Uncharacterized protein n=1 Tax=Adineta steineri TaxID=433720 RepID=A0A814UDL6_9BILA|nr:unnamed protein product [Adineta steineri]